VLKLFDYKCEECGLKRELYVKDDDPQFCHKCGSVMIKLVTFEGTVKGNFADKARTK